MEKKSRKLVQVYDGWVSYLRSIKDETQEMICVAPKFLRSKVNNDKDWL